MEKVSPHTTQVSCERYVTGKDASTNLRASPPPVRGRFSSRKSVLFKDASNAIRPLPVDLMPSPVNVPTKGMGLADRRRPARGESRPEVQRIVDGGGADGAIRSIKSVLETRPIYHKLDETIRGHVFCSFLALMLLKDLQQKMEARGWRLEWERLRRDLDELQEFTVRNPGKTFLIRSQTLGDVGKALQAVGVALGPTVRLLEGENA